MYKKDFQLLKNALRYYILKLKCTNQVDRYFGYIKGHPKLAETRHLTTPLLNNAQKQLFSLSVIMENSVNNENSTHILYQ